MFPFNSLHAKEFNEGNKPKQSRPTHETEGETRHSGITSGESPARVFKSPLIIRERTVSGVSGSEVSSFELVKGCGRPSCFALYTPSFGRKVFANSSVEKLLGISSWAPLASLIASVASLAISALVGHVR